jgi:hypothetical protein
MVLYRHKDGGNLYKKERNNKMKERINKINAVAQENLEKAQGMLDMFNDVYGTQFGLLKRRVVMFEYPNGTVAERYAHCMDVYTLL